MNSITSRWIITTIQCYLKVCIVLTLFYSSVEAQVRFNMTFPDFSILNKTKNSEKNSKDSEFARAKIEFKERESTFDIEFLDQKDTIIKSTKTLELKQESEWLSNDGVDICVVRSSETNKRFILNFISSNQFNNQFWLSLAEIQGSNYERTGSIIHLKNFKTRETEIINFLSADGLSMYQYYTSFDNSLSQKKLSIARSYTEDSLTLSYTSQNAFSFEDQKWFRLFFPLGKPYFSTLTHRNISRNITFDNGIYTLVSDSVLSRNAFYGFSTGETNGYNTFRLSLFTPSNIEIISFKTNRKGSIDYVKNGVIFQGKKGINNILYELKFKIKNTPAEELEKTKIEVKEVITLPSKKVKISVWDNQQEDGDIISLSLNGEWIIRNLEVKKCPTTFYIDLPEKENYFVMKAENLGQVPPNTAAFQISSGDFNKQIILNSDMGKSEMVVFKTN